MVGPGARSVSALLRTFKSSRHEGRAKRSNLRALWICASVKQDPPVMVRMGVVHYTVAGLRIVNYTCTHDGLGITLQTEMPTRKNDLHVGSDDLSFLWVGFY